MSTDHGAAGFCTDHGLPAARPTTVADTCVCGHPDAWHQPGCIGCGCPAMSGREGR